MIAGVRAGSRAGHYLFRAICGLVFAFLVLPLIVIVPLSFNAEPYFTFTREMLTLRPEAFSLRWYRDIGANPQWLLAMKNSLIVGFFATLLSVVLGTAAAVGLDRPRFPGKTLIMSMLISPIVVPIIISAVGMFFFYSSIHLGQTLAGLVLAHTVLGSPFVVITVSAALAQLDPALPRAAANLGASPLRAFLRVTAPQIAPGIFAGGLFAFATSFDEVVVVLLLAGFEQRTIPRQMWAGLNEQISPTILAVATLLILFSVALIITAELLRRRMQKRSLQAV